MAGHLLLISKDREDERLVREIASINHQSVSIANTVDEIRRELVSHDAIVAFWNAEQSNSYNDISQIINKYLSAQRLFVMTEDSLYSYPHLFQKPIFGHHLYKRYDERAIALYARFVHASMATYPFGLDRYFAEKIPRKEISITRSLHKSAAIDALQAFMMKQGIQSRLAGLVAQGVDELIINAMFDAPVSPSGEPTRKHLPRNSDVVLAPVEYVKVEFAQCETHFGISVSDKFGSLSRRNLFESLRKHLEKGASAPKTANPDQGFGLHGILASGMSLSFVIKPNTATQAALFVPMVENFREFKTSFRFLSVIAG